MMQIPAGMLEDTLDSRFSGPSATCIALSASRYPVETNDRNLSLHPEAS